MLSFAKFKAERLTEFLSITRTCDTNYISQDEGDYSRGLYDLIETIKPTSVIEIGSYRGVSTEIFLLCCKRVVAVDPWEYPETMFQEFMERVGSYPNLEVCRGKSPVVLDRFNREFDMSYI